MNNSIKLLLKLQDLEILDINPEHNEIRVSKDFGYILASRSIQNKSYHITCDYIQENLLKTIVNILADYVALDDIECGVASMIVYKIVLKNLKAHECQIEDFMQRFEK